MASHRVFYSNYKDIYIDILGATKRPRSDTTPLATIAYLHAFRKTTKVSKRFMLPDLDGSLILSTPVNFENDGSQEYSAEELAAIIRGKDWTEPEQDWFQELGVENGNGFDESDSLQYPNDYY